ncbi:MAG: 50S ribosome-binding GTPase [Anaerolineales bacterium]|nr:50S ribosome-binding GTPase [Anaerolineales bacterium]
MPTNLPPDYYKAEEQFRKATTNQEKIAWLEEMLSIMPKHKGTDHLKSDLRRKISRLKTADTHKKGGPGRQVSAFHIDSEGAGQVIVLGPANTGKSALVAALTNAKPEVAPYPFSTWGPTPGMMQFENVQIQLIDTPPLEGEFIEPELFNLIRNADMALLVVDLQADPIEQIEETLARLEERRIIPQHLQDEHEGGLRIKYMPILGVVNKSDDETLDEDFEVLCELMESDECPLIPISVTAERHFERLKKAIYDKLGIMRVYSRPPGKEPNFDSPFVLKIGGTVEDFAGKVHQDFRENLKSAKVWGSGAFDGQMVSRDYVLQEGDVVELRI